ncbi:hypothetical protein ACHAXH_010030 [Discostella pseudostelligera]
MLVSIAEEMNPTRRNTQEDAHVVHGPGTWGAPNDHATFIGVMDGHGGRHIADYLEEHLATNIANEWSFAAKEDDGDEFTNNSDNDGSGQLHLPKKQRLGNDDGTDNNKENNATTSHLSTNPAALLEIEPESKAVQTALERAFLITDIQSRLDGIITSGATVACCIVIPNFSPSEGNLTSITIHAANAGDARAVLSSGTALRRRSLPISTSRCSSSKVNKPKQLPNPELPNELPLHRGTNVIRITHDHKSTDPAEIARIQSSGGILLRGRVLGVLAVARSLGDHGLKEFVIAKPHLSSTTIRLIDYQQQHDDNDDDRNKDSPFTDDEFLIVACDGLWDVMEDQEVVDFIRNYIHEIDDDTKHSRQNVASIVVEEALKRGSTDNITVIVYWL